MGGGDHLSAVYKLPQHGNRRHYEPGVMHELNALIRAYAFDTPNSQDRSALHGAFYAIRNHLKNTLGCETTGLWHWQGTLPFPSPPLL